MHWHRWCVGGPPTLPVDAHNHQCLTSVSSAQPAGPLEGARQFRISAAIQRVELVNIGATDKFFVAIGESLAVNASLPLAVLDFSRNP